MSLQQQNVSQPKSLRDCLDPQKPMAPLMRLRNTYLAARAAFLYIMVMGVVTSYSAPATFDMKQPGSRFMGRLTPDEVTWIASLPLFSGVVGNTLAGFLIQKLGRKAVLMCVTVTYTMSWLIIAYSDTVPTIYVGRVLSGLCAGITCVAAPAYVAEISPPAYRGRLSSGFQLAFATGVLLAMSLGAVLRWSWLAVAGAMFVVAASIALLPMPESPPWLLRRSLTQEARKAVKFLRGPDIDLNKEIQDIADNLPKDQAGLGIEDFRDPTFYKPVLISFSLMFFQQFSGINPLMAYTVEIFQGTGGSIPPEAAAVVVAVVQLAATVVSTALVDRSGRRKLLMLSSSFMTVFLIILGLYSYAPTTTFSWVPLFSFVGYIISYSLGVGPIPFVLTPELANVRTRGAVISAACVSCSLFGFVVTKVYEDMKRTLGWYGLYWTYGFFTLCCTVFTYFFVPETKGMSIRQIHRFLSAPDGLPSD